MSDRLQSLLGTLPVERFLSEHWGRRALRVPGAPGRLAGLPTSGELEAVATREQPEPVLFRTASPEVDGRQEVSSPPSHRARQLYEAGHTLVWNHLERHEPRLGALAAGLSEALGHPGRVGVEAFLSPDGQGFGWHFDLFHVFVLQLEGAKRWQLEPEPSVRDPFFNVTPEGYEDGQLTRFLGALGHEGGPPPADPLEEVLEPGDVLYLPPGTWHRAFARGPSYALSVTVRPLSFARVLRAALTWVASRHASWRRDLHLVGWRKGQPPPPELLRFMIERLDDLSEALGELGPAELVAQYERRLESPAFREVFEVSTQML